MDSSSSVFESTEKENIIETQTLKVFYESFYFLTSFSIIIDVCTPLSLGVAALVEIANLEDKFNIVNKYFMFVCNEVKIRLTLEFLMKSDSISFFLLLDSSSLRRERESEDKNKFFENH